MHHMVPQPQKGLVIWFHPVTDFDVSGAAGCGHVTGSNIIFNRKNKCQERNTIVLQLVLNKSDSREQYDSQVCMPVQGILR